MTKSSAPSALPVCTIDWDDLAVADWGALFARCRRTPLTQSYDYARAVCPLYGQKGRWGRIRIKEEGEGRKEGETAGLVQIQEAGILKNLIHGVILDRGPVWCEGYGNKEHQKAFFTEFARQFPARFGRRRRIIPEVRKDPAMQAFFKERGFKRFDAPGYKTVWLDLSKDLETLRADLHKKWRNTLRKAEKADPAVQWDENGETLPWLLETYSHDKKRKGYPGPSPALIRALAGTFVPAGDFIIGRAMIENTPVAAILIICHGAAATYQVGWINDKGKTVSAHNLLLWRALKMLKYKDIKDFDLGGLNDDTAKGVKKFKTRMGGETVALVGRYG